MYKHKGISHLSKSEQKELLEKARYIAFTELGLSSRAVLYFVMSILFGVIVGVITYNFFGSYTAPLLSILVTIWAHQISNGSLIAQGLEHVLQRNS